MSKRRRSRSKGARLIRRWADVCRQLCSRAVSLGRGALAGLYQPAPTPQPDCDHRRSPSPGAAASSRNSAGCTNLRLRPRRRAAAGVAPRLKTRPGAPAEAGVYQATVDQIELVHRSLLFNGAVDACDGTSVPLDTLPITIVQIGICLVSYRGGQGSWGHRLYRRDLRVGGLDPVEEALEVLERRQRRAGFDMPSRRDGLSDLARRGIMAYAERAVLLEKSDAAWRIGHGNPTPYELLTGSGMRELLASGLDLLHRLVVGHRRFLFVPSAPAARAFLTIGNALRPLEYAVVDTITGSLDRIVEAGHYRGGWADLLPRVREFISVIGPQVVVGLYRASDMSPAQLFYAHAEHAHEAALIALGDSALQQHRGFPMLIDLADTICQTLFGSETLTVPAQLAYMEAGQPFQHLPERYTRR